MLWRIAFASPTPDYARDLLPSMVLSGAGVGLALGTLVAAGVQSLPAARAATGSALVNSVRQISSTVGVAVLVTILGARVSVGSTHEFRLAWAVAAALSAATIGIGLRLSRSVTPASGCGPTALHRSTTASRGHRPVDVGRVVSGRRDSG